MRSATQSPANQGINLESFFSSTSIISQTQYPLSTSSSGVNAE
jgi:hypothetical protein